MSERNSERINVWLTPQQAAWLKTKRNASETVRTLIMEAMNMDALARSIKQVKKKVKVPGKGRRA